MFTSVPSYFLTSGYNESIFLSPVTPTEIESYTTQMDNKKSIGPFSISSFIKDSKVLYCSYPVFVNKWFLSFRYFPK